MTKQVRFIPIDSCGLKVREAAEGESESRIVDGTPILFGVRSRNLTPWSSSREVYEVLEPGCISPELLKRSDVVLNMNHSTRVTDIFGRYRGGENDTLKLMLTDKNVQSSCAMPHTNNANDTMELIKRGDITGMSFAFNDDWEDSENGVSYERTAEQGENGKEVWIRHVKRITALYDVSIVTYPAYEQTSVAAREEGDEIMKMIDKQIEEQKREDEPQEPQEPKEPTEPTEPQEPQETDEEREAREQREAEEQAKKERERITNDLRRRAQRMRLNDEYLESLNY